MQAPSHSRIEVSTDAAVRLQTARDWIQAYPADAEILVIAHSRESAAELLLERLGPIGASFGVRRFTLNALASRLAQHTLVSSGLAPASNLSFTAVVARAVHSLLSKQKLTYFTPVATTPGFPVAVAKTLAELRMNEIPPGSLSNLERGGADLALIADTVDRELKTAKLSDRATLFRTAIESIGATTNAGYISRPILLLDVAVHSKLEADLIRELATKCSAILATIPKGDTRTIEVLEQFLQCGRNGHANTQSSNSLSCLRQHLFEESAPPEASLDESVQLRSWPGEPRECIEIVRSIQAEAACGVRFDEMAVLLNQPVEYRSHLEEAFKRASIPAYFVQGTTAPDPAGRAMMALLSCAAENLSARAFAEYLSLGQVPDVDADRNPASHWVSSRDELMLPVADVQDIPQQPTLLGLDPTVAPSPRLPVSLDPAPNIEGAIRTPARWERLLVDSAVIGGKSRWIRRLKGLENELLLRLEDTEPDEEGILQSIRKQLADLTSLRQFALPLIDRLGNLPPHGSWSEWLAHLRELATNALRRPEGVLSTLADLEPMGAVGPVDLHEVQLVLGPRLHDLRLRPSRRRYGSVFVGPIDSARGLAFRVVFVPGLAERLFPRKIVEDPILLDKQREKIDRKLIRKRDQLEVERLALRLAVGSARDRLYLSYPRIDVQQSRPRVPSFYSLEALRAAEGELPGFEEIAKRAESDMRTRLGWPAPKEPEAAIDEAEYDLALLASLSESDPTDAEGRAHYLLTANPHLARALRGRARRWLRRWTPNDGLVDADTLAIESLSHHQFLARSFSATALQNFSSCPYRFFLSAILRLELRQEPAPIETIDPLTRGSLFHETQFEVLTNLKAQGLLPLAQQSIGKAFGFVDAALDRLAGEYEDKFAPAIPRVWDDGVNSIRADLREWLRRMASSEDGWVPDKFELSFGLTDRGPRNSDPTSSDEAVEIIGDLKLRGSIDLVERHLNGNYRVTDHKTGKARAHKQTVVGGGQHLQPMLYALACQKLLGQKVEAGRLYYCTADGGFEDRVVPLDDESIGALNEVLITIRSGLAEAFLPAAPDKGACDWCDFLGLCGSFEEQRSMRKPSDRLVQLRRLRELR